MYGPQQASALRGRNGQLWQGLTPSLYCLHLDVTPPEARTQMDDAIWPCGTGGGATVRRAGTQFRALAVTSAWTLSVHKRPAARATNRAKNWSTRAFIRQAKKRMKIPQCLTACGTCIRSVISVNTFRIHVSRWYIALVLVTDCHLSLSTDRGALYAQSMHTFYAFTLPVNLNKHFWIKRLVPDSTSMYRSQQRPFRTRREGRHGAQLDRA